MGSTTLLADHDAARLRGLEALARASGVATARVADEEQLARVLEHERPAVLFLASDFPSAGERFSVPRSPLLWTTLLIDPGAPPPGELAQAVEDLLPWPRDARAFELALVRATRGLGLLAERREHEAGTAELVELGESPAARRLREQVERVAGTPDTTLLVTGPAGSGKLAVARAVHRRSRRRSGPFLHVRCRRPGNEIEAALFGDALLPGGLLFAPAGGTAFLEEVAALPTGLQDRLAAALDERAGSDAARERTPRLVAASERSLEAEVQAGRFREELLYRLNVLSIAVPPLSAAPGDATRLATALLRRAAAEGLRVAGLSEAAARALEEHPWPGGVRELRATVERAIHAAAGGPLERRHLAAAEAAAAPDPEPPAGDRSLRAMEEALIRRLLREEQGNRSRVARILGINRTTLYNKLRLYGIEDEPSRG